VEGHSRCERLGGVHCHQRGGQEHGGEQYQRTRHPHQQRCRTQGTQLVGNQHLHCFQICGHSFGGDSEARVESSGVKDQDYGRFVKWSGRFDGVLQSLSPGLVATEMTTLNTGVSEERQAMLKSMPILQPQDIAEAIGYVLSTPENVQVILFFVLFFI
jgi:hypothetical protein